jgi:hypothetical protein
LPDGGGRIYSETTEPGESPVYRELARVRPGEPHRVAIVMESPEQWSIVLDGRRVVGPVYLPGSTDWRPVATAESWSPRRAPCNSFAYRFDHVAAISSGSPTWQPLTRVAVLEAGPHYGIARTGASFAAASHA